MEISNKMRYKDTTIKVIDVRDIKMENSTLRLELDLPPNDDDDVFKFLMDITAKYKEANIAHWLEQKNSS